MVKLGDITAPAPFVVNCGKVGGEGRWVDASSWAWQMKRPLKSGERCEFVLRSDRVALNGEALSGKNRFAVFHARPLAPRHLSQAGIESLWIVAEQLDTGFHRCDGFLRDHQS